MKADLATLIEDAEAHLANPNVVHFRYWFGRDSPAFKAEHIWEKIVVCLGEDHKAIGL